MKIEEVLKEIEQAYPEDVFPSLTAQEWNWLMVNFPGNFSRITADLGRHFAQVIARKLKEEDSDDGAGELIRAAQQVLKFRSKILLISLPYQEQMEGLAFALTDLETEVWAITKAGEPDSPSDSAKSI